MSLTFGAELRRAQAAQGVTNIELARRVGVRDETLSNVRRDHSVPSHALALRLAEALTHVGGEWPQSTITLGLPDQDALIEALCAEVRKRVPRLLAGTVECLGNETSCGCEVHDQGPVQDDYVPGYTDDGTPAEPETLPLGLREAAE